MRLGIFGGTFNPIHLGHLRCAEEVREAQRLDRIVFVPSASPPHKRSAGLADADHRWAMVRAAIAGNPHFGASRVELDRPGRSYSVDTVAALQRRYPGARLCFIMGRDAFADVSTWKDGRRFFSLCDVVVASRPPHDSIDLLAPLPVVARGDFCYGKSREELVHESGTRVVFQRISDLEISATRLRRLCREGRSIRYLVPPSVERYIARHGLYGAPTGVHS